MSGFEWVCFSAFWGAALHAGLHLDLDLTTFSPDSFRSYFPFVPTEVLRAALRTLLGDASVPALLPRC